jgi:3'(2'), 5'-bisphosphate nucleotidase
VIEEVKALARQAGHEIKKVYDGTDWSVTIKKDESPLTRADLIANDIIVEGLKKISEDLVVSEEGAPAPTHMPSRFWLVDPLDGTRDFVARKDTFCVCIALIENERPILGAIHAPVTDELWWAEKGQGAFGPRGRLHNARTNTDDLLAVGSRSIPSERLQRLYDVFNVTRVDRFGSALKFCKLAEGLYDLYPRFGPMMEWDTAAGQIIAEEAGCKVIDIRTEKPLRYGKTALESHGFLCSRADLTLETRLKPFLKR